MNDNSRHRALLDRMDALDTQIAAYAKCNGLHIGHVISDLAQRVDRRAAGSMLGFGRDRSL